MMASPNSSPLVWPAWDLPPGSTEYAHDSFCLLQAHELAVVQAMAQEVKAWGLYGQDTGFLEPSPPMPMYDGQQQPIQTITQTEQTLAGDPAFHYTDAAQCALLADLPSYPLIDPELLKDVSPVSSGSNFAMEYSSVDQYGTLHQLAPDHQLLEDVMSNEYATISLSMNQQPVECSNTALDSPISDAFLDDTPPSSPERTPTPPRILPGVYELGGPSGPRPLLPRTERFRAPPPRRRMGNEHATHIQPWGCGVCKTAFMTPHLLRIHQRFHEPAPEFYELVNPAFSVRLRPSEEELKAFSEENERFSARMRCANGEWTSWRQSMHCFGDADEDSGSEAG